MPKYRKLKLLVIHFNVSFIVKKKTEEGFAFHWKANDQILY